MPKQIIPLFLILMSFQLTAQEVKRGELVSVYVDSVFLADYTDRNYFEDGIFYDGDLCIFYDTNGMEIIHEINGDSLDKAK